MRYVYLRRGAIACNHYLNYHCAPLAHLFLGSIVSQILTAIASI
ncbi:hypothetical protein [Anabaena sp. UHCC 0399]|nr:hypothetical protein [Anabaena sp. UHCC 0399]MEA5564386.1 hypothetical protein [Anabaena sp. UHCC 0399]